MGGIPNDRDLGGWVKPTPLLCRLPGLFPHSVVISGSRRRTPTHEPFSPLRDGPYLRLDTRPGRSPAQLKHISQRRKRNQQRFP